MGDGHFLSTLNELTVGFWRPVGRADGDQPRVMPLLATVGVAQTSSERRGENHHGNHRQHRIEDASVRITSEQAGAAGRGGTVTPMSAAIPALLLAAVLLVVAPLLGVVTAQDSSSTSPPVHSAWVAALPVLVVALLALARRGIAVAAVAGVGVFGLVRLIADLGVVIDPGETLRPELFGIQTLSANPLQTGWAAWMLILADVLMLAAAALAGNVIADSLEPVAAWNAGRLELDADALGSPESFVGRPRLMKSSPSSVVGIVAAAGYLAANLGELYADPLPVIRPGFNDIGLWGTITAAVAGLLVAMVVLFSSALDAGVARGLLLGLGLGAADLHWWCSSAASVTVRPLPARSPGWLWSLRHC